MARLKYAFIYATAFALGTAPAAQGGEPGGTPDALFFSEAALAGTIGVACFVGGYAVGGDPKENAGTTREKASYAVYGLAPFASALTVYVVGENAGMRSANRRGCFLATLGISAGATGAGAALAWALTEEDKDAGALSGALYAIIPAAFLNAVVYNTVKKPYFARIPGFSEVEVKPFFGISRDTGELTPVWEVAIWF